MREGVYRETVRVFDDNITFRAAPGENVLLSGADLISGFTLVTGDANRDGVIDNRDNDIYRVDVVFNAPTPAEGPLRDDTTGGNALFVNGQIQSEARFFAENDVLDADDYGQIRSAADLPTGGTTLTSTDLVGFGDDFFVGANI